MRKFLLIDMYNLFHRCKHASNAFDNHTKIGLALHITLNSMRKVSKHHGTEHVVACLEGGSWRKEIYPEYKANRKHLEATRTPKEVREDKEYFDAMNEFVDFLDTKTNVTVLKESRVEGDDFIARWIQLHPDDEHIIFTSDTDFYQLISDKVTIFDGNKNIYITPTSMTTEYGFPAHVTKTEKNPKTGKNRKVKVFLEPPNPEYELFKKCIRGDSSDNIMTAYPKVREKGSLKKPGILEAFNDRHNKGLTWNEFMLTEWEKVIDVVTNDEGDITEFKKEKVTVLQEYKMNKKLIDLTEQPDDIKDLMDRKILEQVQKPPVNQVGVHFLRYAAKSELMFISQSPEEYSKILSARY